MFYIGVIVTEKFDISKIDKLQENLSVLRKVAGWSAEDLAEMIGVTRQTVVNLENRNGYKMTKIQYIAIRAILEAEVENSNNATLGRAIELLIDTENISDESKQEIQRTVIATTSNLGHRAGSAAAGIAIVAALGAVLGTLGIPAAGSMMFVRELLKGDKYH